MEIYYYFFGLCVFIASVVSFLSRKVAAIAVAILLILFAGSRLGVDNDYPLYKYFFQNVNEKLSDFILNFDNLEFAIFYIPNFLKFFFYSQDDIVNGSFITFAIIAVSLKVYSIYKYSNYFLLSFIFYLSSLYYMHEMTTIRAGVSAGLLLLSLNDFEEKNHKGFSWKMALALLFHYSSAIIIICYIITTKIKNIKYYYYALLFSVICALGNLNILTMMFLDKVFPKVALYLTVQEITDEGKVNVLNYKILFSLLLLVLLFSSYKKLSQVRYFSVLYKLHVLSLIIFFILSPTAIIFSLRSFELLSIIQVLFAPMILFLFTPKLKYIGVLIILVFSGAQLYYIISIQDIFKPYMTWLF